MLHHGMEVCSETTNFSIYKDANDFQGLSELIGNGVTKNRSVAIDATKYRSGETHCQDSSVKRSLQMLRLGVESPSNTTDLPIGTDFFKKVSSKKQKSKINNEQYQEYSVKRSLPMFCPSIEVCSKTTNFSIDKDSSFTDVSKALCEQIGIFLIKNQYEVIDCANCRSGRKQYLESGVKRSLQMLHPGIELCSKTIDLPRNKYGYSLNDLTMRTRIPPNGMLENDKSVSEELRELIGNYV